ncbi:MAG: M16 family metallopeptidase [Gemmatimonadaceae bacterium]
MTATKAPPRPSPAPPREYHFPRFERRTLANGARLLVAPAHKLPLVTTLALVDAGAVNDPAGREGLAALTARALVEGTQAAGGTELTERLERLGTSLDASADWDAAVARLTVHAARLEPALALLGEVLMTPAFAERDVERLKAERQAEILQLRAEPRGLADETFDRVLYAPGSRYAAPEGGTAESVARLTAADLRRFHAERYRPGALTLVVVGDVTADDATRLAERVFGAWSGDAPPPAAAADRPARLDRAVHLVAKGDAAQSEIRLGHVGIPRSHPDYFPATVMNAILGGLFSSRINLNLRERHGYTYGAFSGFEWRRGAGPWAVSTAVQSDVTAAAASETLLEIDRTREEAVAEDELTLATSYLDGVFPIRFETTAAIAVALANMEIYGLPADYYDTYRAKVRAVTTSDVLEAARRHVQPERLQLLVVGDPAVVRAPLEALGFGPMTVYDAEGRPTG